MAIPIDKSLYEKVKNEAKKRFEVWPSAYGSGWLVREYKRRGGRYRDLQRSKGKKSIRIKKSKGKSKYKTSRRSVRKSKRKSKLKSRRRSVRKSTKRGLSRWFDEEWINVCKLPKKVPCGRDEASRRNYPYCRPSRRINSNTPVLAQKLSKSEIRRRCSRKRKNPYKRMSSARSVRKR